MFWVLTTGSRGAEQNIQYILDLDTPPVLSTNIAHEPVERGTGPVVPRVVRARLRRRPSAVSPVVMQLLLSVLIHHAAAASVDAVLTAVVALRVLLPVVRVPGEKRVSPVFQRSFWPGLISLSSSPVLRLVNGVVVVNGGLLLYDLAPGARARHGGAEEDVDEEHDGEEHAERDAQPQEPLVRHAAEGRGAVDRARCNVQKLHFSSCN